MRKYYKIITSILICATHLTFAQVSKIERFFKESKYAKVYSFVGKARQTEDIRILRPVAYSAYYLYKYQDAIDLYTKIINSTNYVDLPIDYFHLAQSYRSLANYSKSDSIIKEINYKFPTSVVYPELSNWFRDDIDYNSTFFQSLKNIYGLDSALITPYEDNSNKSEYGLIYNNGRYYYSTNNSKLFESSDLQTNYRNETDFAIIEKNKEIQNKILSFQGESCQLNYIDESGEWFSITVTDSKPNQHNKKILKSYLLKKKNDLTGWDTINIGLNNPNYSITGLIFDKVGQQIFFSSDKPNGFGSSDLYKAKINKIDLEKKVIELGRIENMGPRINTIGREGFPYLLNDSILMFCSDGHLGFGSLDLFSFNLKTNVVYNLGDEINTPGDDFFFTPFDGKSGFYSKSSQKSGDDIFKITYTESWLQKQQKNSKKIKIKLQVPENGKYKISKSDLKVVIADKNNKRIVDLLNKMKNDHDSLSPINTLTLLKLIEGNSPNLERNKDNTKEPSDDKIAIAGKDNKDGNDDKDGSENEDPREEMAGESSDVKIAITAKDNKDGNDDKDGSRDELRKQKSGGFIGAVAPKNDYTEDFLLFDRELDNLRKLDQNKLQELPFEIDDDGNLTLLTEDTNSLLLVLAAPTEGKILPNGIVIDIDENDSYNQQMMFSDYSIGENLNDLLNLNPIYYDFDKYSILEESIRELKKVQLFLDLKKDDNIRVESHTDSRGTYNYNIELSLNRSRSVIKYLTENLSINSERLRFVGFGEYLIENGCIDGIDCDYVNHRNNRRTDFIVQ